MNFRTIFPISTLLLFGLCISAFTNPDPIKKRATTMHEVKVEELVNDLNDIATVCDNVSSTRADMLSKMNAYRKSKGARPLSIDNLLQKAAQDYANVLTKYPNDCCGHEVDGTTLDTRVANAAKALGLVYSGSKGEINCGGYGDPAGAIQAWKDSKKGHHEQMINAQWSQVGYGIACPSSGTSPIWVTVLGHNRSTQATVKLTDRYTDDKGEEMTFENMPANTGGRTKVITIVKADLAFDKVGTWVATFDKSGNGDYWGPIYNNKLNEYFKVRVSWKNPNGSYELITETTGFKY